MSNSASIARPEITTENDCDAEDRENARLAAKMKSNWLPRTQEDGIVEKIAGAYYFFGSETATLRLLKHYRRNDFADQGFSENRQTFYFRLETRS